MTLVKKTFECLFLYHFLQRYFFRFSNLRSQKMNTYQINFQKILRLIYFLNVGIEKNY